MTRPHLTERFRASGGSGSVKAAHHKKRNAEAGMGGLGGTAWRVPVAQLRQAGGRAVTMPQKKRAVRKPRDPATTFPNGQSLPSPNCSRRSATTPQRWRRRGNASFRTSFTGTGSPSAPTLVYKLGQRMHGVEKPGADHVALRGWKQALRTRTGTIRAQFRLVRYKGRPAMERPK